MAREGRREEERAGERRKEGEKVKEEGRYDNNLCSEHCEFLLRE